MTDGRKIRIGTSGWNYSHWKGTFYPGDMRKKEWLSHYCSRFQTVEINNTFYSTISEKAARDWTSSVPEGFVFSIKANRYITHMKKLKNPAESLDRFFGSIEPLKEKTGAVLFQLPPKWSANAERLKRFLGLLPRDYRYAFEFRDLSWFSDEIYRILEARGAALCFYHLEGYMSPKVPTADFIYVRLHGPADEAYRGSYSTEELSGWAGAVSAYSRQGKDVFIYFDNDERGYAAANALKLKQMTG